MLERIKKYKKDRSILREDLKYWVKDKNIPLDIRWKTFMKSDLGYTNDLPDVGPICTEEYSEYFSRYDVIDIDFYLDKCDTDVDIIAFKEDALEQFVDKVKIDW